MKFFRTLVSDSGTLPKSTSDEPLSRSKRQLLVAAAAFSGVLGTFFGLYNSFKIHKIQSDILNLSDQHNLLVLLMLSRNMNSKFISWLLN
jgi:hypothetical protein